MHKNILIAVGCFSIAISIYGILTTLAFLAAPLPGDVDPEKYPIVLYIMSSISMFFYLVILTCGLSFIRQRTKLVLTFISCLILEVGYVLLLGFAWSDSQLGMSIAAATGVANIGIGFQFLILFPVWAPILAYRAKKKLAETNEPSE